MDGCRLEDAAPLGGVLCGASLATADLRRADLRRAYFGPFDPRRASVRAAPGAGDAGRGLAAIGEAWAVGADLRRARLEAARVAGASFRACNLSGADLTDCDLVAADTTRARLSGCSRTPPPPTTARSDHAALWARLRAQPQAVRRGVVLFGLVVHIAGTQSPRATAALSAMIRELGYGQADVDALFAGRPHRARVPRADPADGALGAAHRGGDDVWARCGRRIADADAAQRARALRRAARFSERAMARIIGEEMGVALRVG